MAETFNKALEAETGVGKRKEAGPNVSSSAKKRKATMTMARTPPKFRSGDMMLNWPPGIVPMDMSYSRDSEGDGVMEVGGESGEDARVSDMRMVNEKAEVKSDGGPDETPESKRKSAITRKGSEGPSVRNSPAKTKTGGAVTDQDLPKTVDRKFAKLRVAKAQTQTPVAGKKSIIHPLPVTGNTPPASPKSRPMVVIPSSPAVLRSSPRRAGPRGEQTSTLLVLLTRPSSGYKSPYPPVSKEPTPLPTEIIDSTTQKLLSPPPTQLQSENEYSQESSLLESFSQEPSSQSSSSISKNSPVLYHSSSRRKRLQPKHLPGGLGVRIHGKDLPRGVSVPSSQQILNIITPGVRRRRVTPLIPDEKAWALAEEIIAAKGLAGGNVYDVLRMPVYRSWAEHRINYERITQALETEMAGGGKGVLGFSYVRQAWSTISNPERKAAYDKTLPAQLPTEDIELVPSMPHLALVLEGPPFTPSFHDLSGLEDIKTMTFRIHKPLRMPLHSHISFWTALAYGLRGDMKHWQSIKETTLRFWTSVFQSQIPHPRQSDYKVLCHYGISVGDENLENQLKDDHKVTPEMWQVTADTFSVEILMIINTPANPTEKKINKLPVVPRGSHNRQQVFIIYHPSARCYEPVYPVKKQSSEWRYEKHMPSDRIHAPREESIESVEKETRESDERRCPFLERDSRGVFVQPVKRMKGYEGEIEAPGALVGGGLW